MIAVMASALFLFASQEANAQYVRVWSGNSFVVNQRPVVNTFGFNRVSQLNLFGVNVFGFNRNLVGVNAFNVNRGVFYNPYLYNPYLYGRGLHYYPAPLYDRFGRRVR